MSSWTCLHTHVLVFWWFITYPMAVLIRSQLWVKQILAHFCFPEDGTVSPKSWILFESSKAQPPTFTVFCPSEFRKDLHGGNVSYVTQWGRKSLDAQQCHTVVLRSWCLTVCLELDQRIGCMLCCHIQILEVHHLCSRVLSHLPFLSPHNSLASILNHMSTQTHHPDGHLPSAPLPGAFIPKAPREASEEGFSASLLWGPSFPILSLAFRIFLYSPSIWWKPYGALRILFTGHQPAGGSVLYIRWLWKQTTENVAGPMRELKRTLNSLKSQCLWLGKEDENPGFQQQARSGVWDINKRHNPDCGGANVLSLRH